MKFHLSCCMPNFREQTVQQTGSLCIFHYFKFNYDSVDKHIAAVLLLEFHTTF